VTAVAAGTDRWGAFTRDELAVLQTSLVVAAGASAPPKIMALRDQIGAALENLGAPRKWLVQRCLQKWSGSELLYEDWPICWRGGTPRLGCTEAMTREEMLRALLHCGGAYPEHEFRGHNIGNLEHCRRAGCRHELDKPESQTPAKAFRLPA
jgi:hypothetical protein